jgi:prepilin-type N-terminal cleavage/methylation domain-containing protein
MPSPAIAWLSGSPGLPGCEAGQVRRPASAFTLIELLLVIGIVAVLAALLLPALAAAKARGRRAVCMDNLKQAALSFQMYTADNGGKLAQNYPLFSADSNSWVLGDMKVSSDSTNKTFIRQGKLFPYASQVALYRCPADPSRTDDAPRVRSYSMNGWIGSRYMETHSQAAGYRTFVRESELAAADPAAIWVIADEHEASIDDAWFLVTMDNSKPFASFPATRHEGSYGLNFADGHAEFYKLHDAKSPAAGEQTGANDPDWQRLKQVTTTR